MKRRDFLKTGTIWITALSVIFGNSKINTNKNDTIILSTWEHGLPANDAAWQTLQNGGNAMATAEAGARVPEADPKSTSVGFGGLPDEKGNVTLDACVMDSTGNAGSVAFLQNIKHPVSVACEEALNRVIKRHNGNRISRSPTSPFVKMEKSARPVSNGHLNMRWLGVKRINAIRLRG